MAGKEAPPLLAAEAVVVTTCYGWTEGGEARTGCAAPQVESAASGWPARSRRHPPHNVAAGGPVSRIIIGNGATCPSRARRAHVPRRSFPPCRVWRAGGSLELADQPRRRRPVFSAGIVSHRNRDWRWRAIASARSNPLTAAHLLGLVTNYSAPLLDYADAQSRRFIMA